MRYHRTFGLDAGQLDELEARIEDILPDPWDKGTGRPRSLSLREAIMVTLLYKRQNIIEEVIADLFGVSQGTVSEIITEFTLLIAQATEEFRPEAEDAKRMTRGRLALVDGTLWPCWSWERAPEMWAGKYKTTGQGSLIIGDEFGNIIFVSDPYLACAERGNRAPRGALDYPVGDGRDAQTTLLAVRLGNHPLPHRQRAETAVLTGVRTEHGSAAAAASRPPEMASADQWRCHHR